ncbi:hypothetical protein GCM10009595_11530 [Falsarthrobacter nasiphocae]
MSAVLIPWTYFLAVSYCSSLGPASLSSSGSGRSEALGEALALALAEGLAEGLAAGPVLGVLPVVVPEEDAEGEADDDACGSGAPEQPDARRATQESAETEAARLRSLRVWGTRPV